MRKEKKVLSYVIENSNVFIPVSISIGLDNTVFILLKSYNNHGAVSVISV